MYKGCFEGTIAIDNWQCLIKGMREKKKINCNLKVSTLWDWDENSIDIIRLIELKMIKLVLVG